MISQDLLLKKTGGTMRRYVLFQSDKLRLSAIDDDPENWVCWREALVEAKQDDALGVSSWRIVADLSSHPDVCNLFVQQIADYLGEQMRLGAISMPNGELMRAGVAIHPFPNRPSK